MGDLTEEVFNKEREWLVSAELELVASHLKSLALNSLCYLGTHNVKSFASTVIRDNPTPEEKTMMDGSRIVATIESQNPGQFKGVITANGWQIQDAELKIKTTSPQQSVVKVSVLPQNPVVIQQIQNAHNFLEVSLIQILDLQKYMNKTTNETTKQKLETVSHRIEKIVANIDKAQQQLLSADFGGLPLQDAVPNHQFVPSLPVGFRMRIYIENGELVVALYYLNKSRKQGNPLEVQTPEHFLSTNSLIGYTFTLKETPQILVEVVDQIEIRCKVSSLEAVTTNLNDAQQLCNDFLAKSNALSEK